MFELTEARVIDIYTHWDLKQEFCKACEDDWALLTTSQRREIRNTYEFEEEA